MYFEAAANDNCRIFCALAAPARPLGRMAWPHRHRRDALQPAQCERRDNDDGACWRLQKYCTSNPIRLISNPGRLPFSIRTSIWMQLADILTRVSRSIHPSIGRTYGLLNPFMGTLFFIPVGGISTLLGRTDGRTTRRRTPARRAFFICREGEEEEEGRETFKGQEGGGSRQCGESKPCLYYAYTIQYRYAMYVRSTCCNISLQNPAARSRIFECSRI